MSKILFRVRLLKDTAYDWAGRVLNIRTVDEQGNIYYYDSFKRWCYLTATEERIVWERVRQKK